MTNRFVIASDEKDALLCLREARNLAAFSGGLWPGWDVGRQPFLLFKPSGSGYLIGHPYPPADFVPVHVGAALDQVFHYNGEVRRLRSATAEDFGGVPTAIVPIDFEPGQESAERFVAVLLHEAFHAFQGGAGFAPPSRRIAEEYPVESAVNNAWGRIEGEILYEALAGADAGGGAAARLALEYLAARRSREAMLPPEVVAYEGAMEAFEGLATYIEESALLCGAMTGYRCTAEFRSSVGLERMIHAGAIVGLRRVNLREINVQGKGAARRRFAYTGSALGHLLDALCPKWKTSFRPGRDRLDGLLEEVLLAGGGGSPPVAEAVAAARNLDGKLSEEEAFAEEWRASRLEALDRVMAAGTRRLHVDVTGLTPTSRTVFLERSERVDELRRIHFGGCSFFFGEAMLDFEDVAVVEDAGARTFHCALRPGVVRCLVDGRPFSPAEPAWFRQRLELTAPGVKIIAGAGNIDYVDAAFMVKLTK